jgi:hypothetical protein
LLPASKINHLTDDDDDAVVVRWMNINQISCRHFWIDPEWIEFLDSSSGAKS